MAEEDGSMGNSYEEGSAFNSAIDCLMNISRIISQINEVSTKFSMSSMIPGLILTAGQAQHIKHRLVKSLMIRAWPLLSKPARANIKNLIKQIELDFENRFDPKSGRNYAPIEKYSPKVEDKLTDIILAIEEDLQDVSHYFMPPKKDPRMAITRR